MLLSFGKRMLRASLKIIYSNIPYTPFYDKTNVMLGMLEYENKRYASALTFTLVRWMRIGWDSANALDFMFCKGYASLETKIICRRSPFFKALKNMNTPLQPFGYLLLCLFRIYTWELCCRLARFSKIEEHPAYKNLVPYYIIQIYYAQKEYDKLYEMPTCCLPIIPTIKTMPRYTALWAKLLTAKKRIFKAIGYFKSYEKLTPLVLRNDMYLMGLSYYNTGDFANAVLALSKATTEKDETTENAYLHLGKPFIKLNNKTNARLSYEAALEIEL